jgi:hypothetical protein
VNTCLKQHRVARVNAQGLIVGRAYGCYSSESVVLG